MRWHLLAIFCIAHVLETSHAARSWGGLARIAFAAAAIGFSHRRWRGEVTTTDTRDLCIFMIAVVVLHSIEPRALMYAETGAPATSAFFTLKTWIWVPLVAAILSWNFSRPGLAKGFAILFLALGLVERGLATVASPNPVIDVFHTTREAIHFWMNGENPYLRKFTDTYRGTLDYPVAFGYLPLVLIIQSIFEFIARDFRWGYLVAHGGIAFGLWRFAAHSNLGAPPWIWPCAVFALPASGFMMEQAWIEPWMMFGMVMLLLAWKRGDYRFVGLLAGLLSAYKQTFWAVAALLSIQMYSIRPAGWKKSLSPGIFIFLGLMGWFAKDDPVAFFGMTFGALTSYGVRADALSIPGMLRSLGASNHWLMPLTSAVNLLGFLGCAWWVFRNSRARPFAWLHASSWVLLLAFGFGHMAFCNYYYFLAFVFALDLMARRAHWQIVKRWFA